MAQVSSPILDSQPLVPYRIRQANLDLEASEIIRLCKAGGLQSSIQKYLWKYETYAGQRAWCNLAIDNISGRPVGTTALFPRTLLIEGNPVAAAVAGDFAVEAEHRTLYPAISLQKSALQACRDGRFEIIYGFPNDAARLVQLRAGYLSVGVVRSGIRPLHTRRFFEASGNRRWWGIFADAFDRGLEVAANKFHRQFLDDYYYRELAGADERFDRFWAEELPRYRIVLERNSRYVNWRFMQCPYRTYRLLAALHRQTQEIGGYVFWSSTPDGKVRIFDLMASDHVFEGLVTAFLRLQEAHDATCITVVYFGNDRLVRRLRRFGFFFRQTRSQVLLSVNPRLPKAQMLFDPQNWYLSEGDSDS